VVLCVHVLLDHPLPHYLVTIYYSNRIPRVFIVPLKCKFYRLSPCYSIFILVINQFLIDFFKTFFFQAISIL
jgi:hypothetical protein